MTNITEYKNLIAFHPGSFLVDIVEDIDISVEEFSERLGTSPKNMYAIINGKQKLTPDMAHKISNATGTSVELWIGLQADYDSKIVEIEYEKQKEREIDILAHIDYDYFCKYFNLEKFKRNSAKKVKALMKKLSISSLTNLENSDKMVASYRNTAGEFEKKNKINTNIMLNLATSLGNDINAPKYNEEKLKNSLPKILKLTKENDFDLEELINILKESGIALVALPYLKNSSANGAVRELNNGSILIYITDKGKKLDIFWFTLFHEIAHILNKDYEKKYNVDLIDDKVEDEVDLIARNLLIEEEMYTEFVNQNKITKESIEHFCHKNSINPGILVGRLQNDRIIGFNKFNNLRVSWSIEKNFYIK